MGYKIPLETEKWHSSYLPLLTPQEQGDEEPGMNCENEMVEVLEAEMVEMVEAQVEKVSLLYPAPKHEENID